MGERRKLGAVTSQFSVGRPVDRFTVALTNSLLNGLLLQSNIIKTNTI